jgi:HK97 family phage prohead protease
MTIQHLNCNLMELKLAGGSSEEGSEVKEMSFTGYGAVFGNIDSYGDAIQKGAFRETLRETRKTGIWPSLLLQHGGWGMNAEDMTPIGIISEMEEDDVGLKMDAVLAPTQRGSDAYALMKMTPRPAISGLSIGYIPVEWKRNETPKEGEARRTLTKIKLMEVSLVTFPANSKARVLSVKSGLDIRIAERALRDAGFSRSESKAILTHGFKSLNQCDADAMDKLTEQIKRNIAILSNS